MTNPLTELKRIAKTLDRPLGLHTWKVSLKDKETGKYALSYGPHCVEFFYQPDNPLIKLIKKPAEHAYP